MHTHHGLEEKYYFPWLEERLGPNSMHLNLDGHHSFEAPFSAFERLVASIRDRKQPYVPTEFRKVIYDFVPPLFEHLRAEVETLRPEKVRHIPEAEVWKMEAEVEAEIKRHGNLTYEPQLWQVNGDGKYGAW